MSYAIQIRNVSDLSDIFALTDLPGIDHEVGMYELSKV